MDFTCKGNILPIRARLAALLLAALALVAPATTAAAEVGHLLITAVVARHASIRMQPPATFTISDTDVAQGYVDVPLPIEVMVRSNAPDGYMLQFQPMGEAVQQVIVDGFSQRLVVGMAGASASRPATRRGVWMDALTLRVRFELTRQARTGVHAWPLQVTMEPT